MTKIETGLYQHYKGNYYNVMGLCRHAETLEILVIYQALYNDYRLWVRPLDLFLSTVEEEGKTRPRFKLINPLFNFPPTLR